MSKAIQVYDTNGNAQDTLTIDLHKRDLSSKAYSCAVKVLRQNWRQGTVGCKGRGEVSFSNKKPWKQKGTGRARVGTKSSPIWRKGGVTFGPQERSRTLKMSKQQRSLVFNNIFHTMNDAGKIFAFDFEITGNKPSTKNASEVLKKAGLFGKKVAVFATLGDVATTYSFRNLPNVNLISFDEPNAISLTNCEHWVFLKKDVNFFKDMVSKWN